MTKTIDCSGGNDQPMYSQVTDRSALAYPNLLPAMYTNTMRKYNFPTKIKAKIVLLADENVPNF